MDWTTGMVEYWNGGLGNFCSCFHYLSNHQIKITAKLTMFAVSLATLYILISFNHNLIPFVLSFVSTTINNPQIWESSYTKGITKIYQ